MPPRLRVLHVATLLTPDGAYGGPVRVATNQVRSLRARGHDAVLVAAASGFDRLPTTWDGVPVVTFPAVRAVPGTGFAGIAAPAMVRWIRTHGARADVAHVHLARDLVTLPAAAAWSRSGKPFVTQTHGMVMPSGHPFAAPLDAVLTRRVVARASTSFALTPVEEAACARSSAARRPCAASSTECLCPPRGRRSRTRATRRSCSSRGCTRASAPWPSWRPRLASHPAFPRRGSPSSGPTRARPRRCASGSPTCPATLAPG